MKNESGFLAVDPVGWMNVNPAEAAASEEYQGKTHRFCSAACHQKFQASPGSFIRSAPMASPAVPHAHSHNRMTAAAPRGRSSRDLAKESVCGMMVDKVAALHTERAGQHYYFCISGCQRRFEPPEQELKSMRLRVTIAFAGVHRAGHDASRRVPRARHRSDGPRLGADSRISVVHLGLVWAALRFGRGDPFPPIPLNERHKP